MTYIKSSACYVFHLKTKQHLQVHFCAEDFGYSFTWKIVESSSCSVYFMIVSYVMCNLLASFCHYERLLH